MVRICVITSDYPEAGTIDRGRLSEQMLALRSAFADVTEVCDPTQWELEKHIATGRSDIYFPMTIYSFCEQGGGARQRDFSIPLTIERFDCSSVGSGALTHLLARDKVLVTRQSGLSLPTELVSRFQLENDAYSPPQGRDPDELVIVKPNSLTSSIGISDRSVLKRRDVVDQMKHIFASVPLAGDLLIQPYHREAREFTAAVLGNGATAIVAIHELIPITPQSGHAIYCRSQKEKAPEQRCMRYVVCKDPDIRHALTFHARRLFDWFNMKDYARFDFIYVDRPYLIDVNSMPVLGHSFGAELHENFGQRYEYLMGAVLEATMARLAASGRPQPRPAALDHMVPAPIQSALRDPPPMESFPESTVPSAFKPTTARYTMVDRIGAETEVLYFLKALVHLIKPERVLETGTYKGATASAIGLALAANGTGRLTTLECDEAFATASKAALQSLPIEVINISSLDYIPEGLIDLLFLDSHRPMRVKEFHHFKSHLADQALILWHDSAPEHAVVHEDIAALVAAGEIDAVLLPTPRGLTISKLRRRQALWSEPSRSREAPGLSRPSFPTASGGETNPLG